MPTFESVDTSIYTSRIAMGGAGGGQFKLAYLPLVIIFVPCSYGTMIGILEESFVSYQMDKCPDMEQLTV